MKELPQDLQEYVINMIPRDKDAKSPTAALIQEVIDHVNSFETTTEKWNNFLSGPLK